ncbi:MAG: hypothetical protein ACPGXK_12470 [Phycisphaerae bacterium]
MATRSTTADHVRRIVERDFDSDHQEGVWELLHQYPPDTNSDDLPERVHLALLKCCDGNLDKLKGDLAIACEDHRVILAQAEHPVVFIPGEKTTEEEVERLNPKQYLDWLNRS